MPKKHFAWVTLQIVGALLFFVLVLHAQTPTVAPVQTQTAQAPLQAPPEVQIRDNWLIDLRTVAAVGTVVVLGAWNIGRWMKKIDLRLSEGEHRFEALEKRLAKLPCQECEEEVQVRRARKPRGD